MLKMKDHFGVCSSCFVAVYGLRITGSDLLCQLQLFSVSLFGVLIIVNLVLNTASVLIE